MKIIHCADLHLDSKMTANLGSAKAAERRAELLAGFSRMVSFADSRGASAILISGDLFDVKRITASARNAVLSEIISHPGISFYYLKGNHDMNNFLDGAGEIPENLKLFGTSWSVYSEGAVRIYGAELTRENTAEICGSLITDPDCFNIVMLHGQEAAGSGRGKDINIEIKKYKNRGIDYLALGHVHEYKREKLDGRGIYCYPGCLEGRGFDECGEHGFVLLDIDEEKRTFTDRFIPFAFRNIYEVDTDISGLETSPQIVRAAKEAADETGCRDADLVKIVLTGSADVNAEKDIGYIEKSLEDNFYFVKVYDNSSIKIDERQFMLDASLKGEFVRLVMSDEELSDEDKGEIISYGLRALAGESI